MTRSTRPPLPLKLPATASVSKVLSPLLDLPVRLMQAGDFMGATAAIQRVLNSGWGSALSFPNLVTSNERVGASSAFPASPFVPASPGSFSPGVFTHGSESLPYKLFIPSSAGSSTLPLVVMLHGCSQNPDDFALGTAMNQLADMFEFFVLYPEQPQHANAQGCWNWFKHNHQEAGRGEPARIAGATRFIMEHYPIDPDRVFVAGLSAGGAMAAILGKSYPDLYSAVGVHSGLAAGAADDLGSALLAMRHGASCVIAPSPTPTIVFHGAEDRTVHPVNGSQVACASAGPGSTVFTEKVSHVGGLDVERSVHRDPSGHITAELWACSEVGHAWFGGDASGSYTDARGPNASFEMIRFFMEHPRPST